MWHCRPRLCFLVFIFLVSSFPAVGDLGQELAEILNFGFSPHMDDTLSHLDNFWSRNLTNSYIMGQRIDVNAKLSRCLSR